MRMQVRLGGVSAIAQVPKNIARIHFISDLHFERARPHMRVARVKAIANIHYDMVVAGVEEVDVDRDLSGMGDVLRNPVQNFDYFARSHAVDRRVIAEVTGILVFWVGPCRSYTIDQTITYPINRIALRNKRSPTIEKDRSAMRSVWAVVSAAAQGGTRPKWRPLEDPRLQR